MKKKKIFLILLMMVVMIGLFGEGVFGQTRLVYEDFEDGTLGVCYPMGSGGDSHHMSITTENPRDLGSSRSVEVVYQGSDNLQHFICPLNEYNSGELYVKFYYRYDEDFHIHYNHKMGRLIESDDTYPAQQMELLKHGGISYRVMGMGAIVNVWFNVRRLRL